MTNHTVRIWYGKLGHSLARITHWTFCSSPGITPPAHGASFVSRPTKASMGLLQLGPVALDGTMIKSNAPQNTRRRASVRMRKTEADLAATVLGWLQKADTLDVCEDTQWGRTRRGNELRRESRTTRRDGRKFDTPRPHWKPKPVRVRRAHNCTDPDRWIMKTSDGFVQGCIAQAAVDAVSHIIVTQQVTTAPNDQQHTPWSRRSRQTSAAGPRGVGRCRIVLGSEPPGTEAAACPGLHSHRSAPPHVGGGRNPSRPTRGLYVGPCGSSSDEAQSESIPTTHTDDGSSLRADQTGTSVSADAVPRTRPCGTGVELGCVWSVTS